MVPDRSSVGSLWWAMARRSSSASIHRGRALTGRRGSGTPDFVPACRHRDGSAFGTPGTSTVSSTHSETRDHRHAAAHSQRRIEQRCGRSRDEKSRVICGCGVLFLASRCPISSQSHTRRHSDGSCASRANCRSRCQRFATIRSPSASIRTRSRRFLRRSRQRLLNFDDSRA